MSASLYLMVAVSLFFALRGILGHNRLFEFPTLAALLYLAFFVPQALAAERNPLLRAYDPWALWFYMTVALVAIAFGFAIGKRGAFSQARGVPPPPIERRRLEIGAAALILIGLFAVYQVNSMAEAASARGTSWTGEITAWFLLLEMLFYGFAISWLGLLRVKNSTILKVLAAISFIFIVWMVNSNVKRTMIAEVAIILAGAWFFLKFKQPPKGVVLISCFLGTVLLHQVGDVRQFVNDKRGSVAEAVVEGVPFKNFRYFNSDSSPEIRQAIVDVYSVNRSGEIDGPASLWNRFVHQYVPSFLVGRQAKNDLMVEVRSSMNRDYRLEAFDFGGATRTGFSDSYMSYGSMGFMVFLVIGMLFGWLYGMSIKGRLWAQFYYLLLLNDGLLALTESTDRFFTALPYTFALTVLVVVPRLTRDLAKRRSKWRARRGQVRHFRPNQRRRPELPSAG
ncbi:hypothetical protein GCM10009127_18380 [Alteraurantiacibacter aestuarii]|uniref:hypothetical protein n=1 Tax=Alteraurantiacibacter aestuarii TaxID=650004 RepID=UPI0031DBFB19